MLKFVPHSRSSKTNGIAVTYRSGEKDIWATCPGDCPFHCGEASDHEIDHEYIAAEYLAVPRQGEAWTYTAAWRQHMEAIPFNRKDRTVFNLSAVSIEEAEELRAQGRDVVVSLPEGTPIPKNYVPCPAEREAVDHMGQKVTCETCGYPGRALCARPNRKWVVVFKRKHVSKKNDWRCYGDVFRVKRNWEHTLEHGEKDDAETVVAFAKSLPARTRLRHRVTGDCHKA